MPVALPGVGPALPTATPTAASPAASMAGASPAANAPATTSAHSAAAANSSTDASTSPATDATGAQAAAAPQDFKALLQAGLSQAGGDATGSSAPDSASPAKKTQSAQTSLTGDALAAAMAVLAPTVAVGLHPAARPSSQAGTAAAGQVSSTASTGKPTLAGSMSLTLGANPHGRAGTAQSETAAAVQNTVQNAAPDTAAIDPAKIAATGKDLPAAALPDAKASHPLALAVGDNSALLSAGNMGAAPSQATAAANSAALPGNPPVNSPAFADALGEKMVWMSKNDLQAAHLQLNPPELGPLSIHLTVSDNQVSAYFVSAHAPVREAIAAALPRLQDMMSSSGMTLGQANVGSESSANANGGQGQFSRQPAWPTLAGDGGFHGADVAPAAWRPLSRGRVDTFV